MRAIGAVVGLVVLPAAVMSARHAGRAKPSLLEATICKLPIHFVENRGVYPDEQVGSGSRRRREASRMSPPWRGRGSTGSGCG